MNIIRFIFLFVFLLVQQVILSEQSTEKPMTIIVRSYNNKDWYNRNLDSILSQNYTNYRVLYYDDASSDNTGGLVEAYLQTNDPAGKVILICNQERLYSMENLYIGACLCEKNEVIVDMDGDDWFFHDDVLSSLNEVYADPDVWMTYGSYITYPDNWIGIASEVPQEVIDQNIYRNTGGCISHLRTYYAGLFQKIKKEDLFYHGNFVTTAQDVAYIVPMMEMGGKHSRYISKILYVYNRANPINDDKVDRSLQWRVDQYIRSQEKYEPIDDFN